MTTNKRNQDRTGQLSTHNIFLIKQLSQWRSLSKNKLVRRAKITLGSSKLNCSRQYVIISILLVLDNFIKNLFITKLRDDSCVLFRGLATGPSRRTGMHFDFINCSVTYLDANLPTLPKIASRASPCLLHGRWAYISIRLFRLAHLYAGWAGICSGCLD